ncbi:MAG: FAD-dependent oxidoreductase [Dehalogenimonas sp.]
MNNERGVTAERLVPNASVMRSAGGMFCTATAMDADGGFEIIYHFNLDNSQHMEHWRLKIAKNDTVPSLSSVYLCASLIENEISELFGIKFENQALDYLGGMMVTKDSPKTYLVKPPDYQPRKAVRLNTPCHQSCPAGIDIPRYVRLCGEGEFDAALVVIHQSVPFPGVLGRVCLASCEATCRQEKQHEGISIKLLKRLAYERGHYVEPSPLSSTSHRIAIVGSGPAGLTAAYFLARLGNTMTVFEALPEAGGHLRYGIPETELPRSILDAEIGAIAGLGVKIETNHRVDNLENLLDEGFDAVLIAFGAHQGIRKSGVIAAVSGKVDLLKRLGLEAEQRDGHNIVSVDKETLKTNKDRIFAAGDITTGPTSVIEAIASGRRAAESIHKFLGGTIDWPETPPLPAEALSRDTIFDRREPRKRQQQPNVPFEKVDEVGEEEFGLTPEMAVKEGRRCWRCDVEV